MESKKLSTEEIIMLIENLKGVFSEYKEQTSYLYQGYCYYFAMTLISILKDGTLCKNEKGNHYFILYDNKYYDAREFYDEENKRTSIPTKIVTNQTLVKDLDDTYTLPTYIEKDKYLEEYYNAGQFGSVRDDHKDAFWTKLYPLMYETGINVVNSLKDTMTS